MIYAILIVLSFAVCGYAISSLTAITDWQFWVVLACMFINSICTGYLARG